MLDELLSSTVRSASAGYAAALRGLYPVLDSARGIPIYRALAELDQSQWWSQQRIVAHAEARLQRLVQHLYQKMPDVRARFDQAGCRPEDIVRIGDLTRIPVTEKAFLRGGFERCFGQQDLPDKDRFVARTGGSTGDPLFFRLSRDARTYDRASYYRFVQWAGSRRGDSVYSVWGAPVEMKALRRLQRTLKMALLSRAFYLDAFDMKPATMDAFLDRLQRQTPRLLRGYTNALAELARHVVRTNRPISGLRGVMSTAEQVQPWQRAIIEQAFGAPLFDQYGCGEVQGVSAECELHTGLHVALEHVIVEIVDERGQQMPPGQVGRVALTGLDNYATPFLRYINGDEASLLPDPCPCGRGLPLMSPVQGRTSDMIYGLNGVGAHGEFFSHIIHELGWTEKLPITEFQVVQEDKDFLRFDIAAGSMPSDKDIQSMFARIRDYLGPMRIELRKVEHVDRGESGKRRFTRRAWNPPSEGATTA